jgi:aminomethyltransferase
MRNLVLHDRHVNAGARISTFAGWQMPIQYQGIREEHQAVRHSVGVFDVSHMGKVESSGPDALAYLQQLMSNDIAAIPVDGAQYSLLCREDGGVLDDVFTYRLAEDRFFTITNAANHERDLQWMQGHRESFDVELRDCSEEFVMLAVQGPKARESVAALADGELPPRFSAKTLGVAGISCLVCGTGYTGEDGVEILCPNAGAEMLWDSLILVGARPAGLGARDTLRLEACFHLYGNDLMESRGPIEAGLGWCCKEETGFIGSQAVARSRAAGPRERLSPFRIEGPGIARQGDAVIGGGVVTSGTFSPSLQIGVGLAYLPSDRANSGEEITIDVRGHERSAVVVKRPIYQSVES